MTAVQDPLGRPLLRFYGPAGLMVIVIMEAIALLGIAGINIWVTPISWYGYIAFVDWLTFRRQGRSLLTDDFREFIFMLHLSIPLWLIFELHNLRFFNWSYVGLPDSRWVTVVGMGLSFATILPAIIVTDRYLKSLGIFRMKVRPHRYGKGRLVLVMILGIIFIAAATFLPSIWTGPLIWPGYLFLFVPLNYLFGEDSILGERKKGDYSATLTLFFSGYVCGLVWELLNYWAGAKWVYTVPFFPEVRIFEMPVIGFLGFGPFAIAFVEMSRLAHKWIRRYLTSDIL